jgi:capsular exopolysaccharide synthesis family protein
MPTADLAAEVLNAITERYLEVAGELKRARLDELTAILSEQLAYADSQLTTRERELEGYRVQTITLPSERATPVTPGLEITRDPVFGSYFARKVALEQLREDRAAIQDALESADGGLSLEALEIIPSVGQHTELTAALGDLAELRSQLRMELLTFTPEHPDVVLLQAAVDEMETRNIPTLARTLVRQLDVREETLDGLIASASNEMQGIPPRMIEEARLRRGVAIAENLYTQLQQKHEESRLAAASAIPDVRILDTASVPRRPVRDDRHMVILLAFGSSLGLALLGAVLRDRTDQTIRYPTQVTDDMGLQILGALPRLRTARGQVDAEAMPALMEALRGVRLSLAFAHGSAGPLMVTVTSPGPADGKTFFTSNLGLSFSLLGRRTLLIDGDIRRGTMHRVLSAERSPGLTDYLAGEASLEEVVRSTGHDQLDLLASGTRRHIGPELLGSAKMKQLILEMRTRYDVVLVDSPPLAAGVDPLILATLTGSLALVLRNGSTKRSLAESQLAFMHRLPVRMLGAILNDVDKAKGGYYHYEQYMYLPNYRAQDEEEFDEPRSGPPPVVAAGANPDGEHLS